MHLQKLINNFHNKYPEQPTVNSLPLDFTLPIPRQTVLKNLR